MRLIPGLILTILGLAASAAIPVDPYDTTVVPGQWCGNFSAAKAYAAEHDIPLVLVWGEYNTGSGECPHCAALTAQLDSEAGRTWASQKRAVFCFVEGTDWYDTPPNEGAFDFAESLVREDGTVSHLTEAPMVRMHWAGRKSVHFSGLLNKMYSNEGSTLLAQFENSVEKFISEVDIPVSYADFPMGDYPCDRLEALAGKTTYVDVPLVRTNGVEATAACLLKFEFGTTTVQSNVNWLASESFKQVRFRVPSAMTSGQQATLTLAETGGSVLAVRHLWCIDEVENSPKNPYWIGEKTATSLSWGEWTMDLNIVTNKVKAYNATKPAKKAYAMMFVGGSCWCPDCAMAEANFFNKQAFKTWAADNKVVFGVLDIPNNPQAVNAYPSQLRYETYRTSDDYVKLRSKTRPADETQRYQSGAGYLSRHSVDYADALAVAARNAFLVGNDTLNGGWNRPERSVKTRTGVPVLLLLREDGSVAARWERFSTRGPEAYNNGYLRRFEEMFALTEDTEEEADNDKSTSRRTLAGGEARTATVSTVDAADMYALVSETNRLMTLTLQNGGAGDLVLSAIDGTSGVVLTNVTVAAATTGELDVRVNTTNLWAKVAPKIKEGTYFWYTTSVSTLTSYDLRAQSFKSGGLVGFAFAATNVQESAGTVALAVTRTGGDGGELKARVSLTGTSGEAAKGRYVWQDCDLTWADGETGTKTAVLTLVNDTELNGDFSLEFGLSVTKADSKDAGVSVCAARVNVQDDDLVGEYLYRYVRHLKAVAVEGWKSGDEIELTLEEGALPEGLTAQVVFGQVVVEGVPVVRGPCVASYRVRVLRNGTPVAEDTILFEYTVGAYDFSEKIPSLSTTRTYSGLSYVDDEVLKGLLTVTVPQTGCVSGKFMCGRRTYAFAIDGWDSFDPESSTLTTMAADVSDASCQLTVVLRPDGGQATIAGAQGTSGTLSFDLSASVWPEGAAQYRGQYAVQMPQTNIVDGTKSTRMNGSAYMALRMISEEAVAEGSMMYAGVLPNGRAFYGTTTLGDETVAATLPVYALSDAQSAPFVFSGVLMILPLAEQNYKVDRWSVGAYVMPVWETLGKDSHSSEFNVFGGYYDCTEISSQFGDDMSGEMDNLAFTVDVTGFVAGRYGSVASIAPVAAEMTSTNYPGLVDGAANPQNVKLSFSLGTGVIRGSFVVPFANKSVSVTYRGIALPGWQACMSCKKPGTLYAERPWATGSCSMADRLTGVGTIRNGCEIKLEKVR